MQMNYLEDVISRQELTEMKNISIISPITEKEDWKKLTT
jgi:hypothetical protein